MPITIPLTRLKKLHQKVTDEYIKKFSKKQGVPFKGWLNESYMRIAKFESEDWEDWIEMHELIFDINTNQPKGRIYEYRKDPFMDMDYQTYCKRLNDQE